MKTLLCMAMAFIACVAVSVSLGAGEEKEAKVAPATIPGVKGTVYRVNGNKQKDSKVTCHAHDVVEIDWSYPIVVRPSKVAQHSSNAAVVKATGIHGIVNVPLLGTDTSEAGAFFRAEKTGQAELTFTIYRGSAETVLKCEVDVK